MPKNQLNPAAANLARIKDRLNSLDNYDSAAETRKSAQQRDEAIQRGLASLNLDALDLSKQSGTQKIIDAQALGNATANVIQAAGKATEPKLVGLGVEEKGFIVYSDGRPDETFNDRGGLGPGPFMRGELVRRKLAEVFVEATPKPSAAGKRRQRLAATAAQNFDQPDLLALGDALPQLTGWASTKPKETRWHYYQDGASRCNYQRQAGVLVFAEADDQTLGFRCSSCENHLKRDQQNQQLRQNRPTLARMSGPGAPDRIGTNKSRPRRAAEAAAPARLFSPTTTSASPTSDRQAILDGNPT